VSRSRKKHPFIAICGLARGSMKKWKIQCNGKVRRDEDTGNFSFYKKTVERYTAPDDGKGYAGPNSSWMTDPKQIEKLKRK